MTNATLDHQLADRYLALDTLKEKLNLAQNRMAKNVDRHYREVEWEIEKKVYLKLQPYRHTSLAKRHNEKLSPRYYGLYEIVERIGKVAYRLDLPQRQQSTPFFMSLN